LESRYLQQTFLIQTADNIKDIRWHSAPKLFSDHFPVYIYLIKENNKPLRFFVKIMAYHFKILVPLP
jgi:hypothetical protein